MMPKFEGDIPRSFVLKPMAVWLDKVWTWLAVASDLFRLTACPLHCHPSVLPWICLGFLLGFCLPVCPYPVLVCPGSSCLPYTSGPLPGLNCPLSPGEIRELIRKLQDVVGSCLKKQVLHISVLKRSK